MTAEYRPSQVTPFVCLFGLLACIHSTPLGADYYQTIHSDLHVNKLTLLKVEAKLKIFCSLSKHLVCSVLYSYLAPPGLSMPIQYFFEQITLCPIYIEYLYILNKLF